MSEDNNLTPASQDQGSQEPETETPALPRWFRRLKRLGCGLLLVLWFAILLLPCFFIVLATQQQIVISQGSLPGQQLRVWLIMEETQRGLGFSTTAAQPMDADLPVERAACLQTHVSYLLWQGEGDPASFCDCFTRAESEAWNLVETYNGACQQKE